MQAVRAYSDGACKKTKKGGWGAAYFDGNFIFSRKGGKDETTNQEMEMQAMIEILKLIQPLRERIVTIHSDSMYVLNGVIKSPEQGEFFNGEDEVTGWIRGWRRNGWKTANGQDVKYKDMWTRIIELASSFTLESKDNSLKFIWVKGHSNDEGNDLVDRLANEGLLE